ncbi:MAG: RDD family protein [Pseudomonadota bacterium]
MNTDSQTLNDEGMSTFYTDWRYFDGVRTKRILAFLIDYLMVGVLVAISAVIIFFIGFITLGAGWLLYAILVPLVALSYVSWTMSGPRQATWGMQMMGIKLARYDGQSIDWMTALVHAVLFWATTVIFAPLLLAPLFLEHKRTLHDLAMGTVVVRSNV